MDKKKGRPAGNTDDRKSDFIMVRFTRYDKMRLKERAKKDRISMAHWIRNRILDRLNGE